MTAIAVNTDVPMLVDPTIRTFGVKASEVIYKGALVGLHPVSLYLKAYEPCDYFVGVAYEAVTGTATAGAVTCRVYTQGDFVGYLASVAQADVGSSVYALDSSLTVAKNGHWDGYCGNIIGIYAANYPIIRLKPFMSEPLIGSRGSFKVETDFMHYGRPTYVLDSSPGEAPGADSSGMLFSAGGAGMASAAAGFIPVEYTGSAPAASKTGSMAMLLDNDSEAEYLNMRTGHWFDIAQGITYRARLTMEVAGNSTDDMDLGLYALSGGMTATQFADISAATAGVKRCVFHMILNGLDLCAGSDNNSTVVADTTDTTVNLVAAAYNVFDIVARPAGNCELWVDGTQKLSTTVFAISTSGLFCGFINLEKSTGTGVPRLTVDYLRVAGGHV